MAALHSISGHTRRLRQGANTIEFTFVGIPIIFVLISIFEMSRGMWIYETAAHAVREGVRYATVHGYNCVSNPPTVTNACAVTAADVAQVIRNAGVGLDPAATTVTFIAPAPGGSSFSCALNACPATTWPPPGANTVGTPIQINIATRFRSALAMFWPGSAPVSFAETTFGATSMDFVQF